LACLASAKLKPVDLKDIPKEYHDFADVFSASPKLIPWPLTDPMISRSHLRMVLRRLNLLYTCSLPWSLPHSESLSMST
jgi:hypothetical protein